MIPDFSGKRSIRFVTQFESRQLPFSHIRQTENGIPSRLQKDLETKTAQLRMVEAPSQVRDLLQAHCLEGQSGDFGSHLSVDQRV